MYQLSKRLTALPPNSRDQVLRRIADRDLGCGCDFEKPGPDTAEKFEDSIAGLRKIDVGSRLMILIEIDRLIEEETDVERAELQLPHAKF